MSDHDVKADLQKRRTALGATRRLRTLRNNHPRAEYFRLTADEADALIWLLLDGEGDHA